MEFDVLVKNGQVVDPASDHEVVGKPGHGRFVAR